MSRRVAILSNIPPSFSSIFGANYYDDWDFDNAGSLSLTGSLINSITSQGSNGAVFSASGTARPTLVSNDINGKDVASFDGVTDVMSVAASTAMYNFLHNATGGGAVILVYKTALANPNNFYVLLNNNNSSLTERGITLFYDDRSSLSRNNQNRVLISNGLGAPSVCASGDTNDVITSLEYNFVLNTFDGGNATLNQRATLRTNGLFTVNDNTQNGSATASNATRNLTLGATATTATFYFNGSVARIIIINSQPTATQIALAQRRLEYEYGIFPI